MANTAVTHVLRFFQCDTLQQVRLPECHREGFWIHRTSGYNDKDVYNKPVYVFSVNKISLKYNIRHLHKENGKCRTVVGAPNTEERAVSRSLNPCGCAARMGRRTRLCLRTSNPAVRLATHAVEMVRVLWCLAVTGKQQYLMSKPHKNILEQMHF